MEETRRIVMLGKTGAGKSSLANTIFGENVFTVSHTLNSETRQCQAETRSINGRSIRLIDTPGFFDTDMSEEKMKTEIVRCITECAPGPHVFLILLKVEKFTEHEKSVIGKICEYFSEEALKYAAVVFTHGDQLDEGVTIKRFVNQNKCVSDLVKKCGDRCHVVDNKYWKIKHHDEYRSNQFQVEELLNTIDNIVEENNRGCYTNEMLQTVGNAIQQEEAQFREKLPEQEIREQARLSVFNKLLIRLAGIATGAVLGAFLGAVGMIGRVVTALEESSGIGGAPLTSAMTGGALKGGLSGFAAAEGADTAWEAADRAAAAVKNDAQSYVDQ